MTPQVAQAVHQSDEIYRNLQDFFFLLFVNEIKIYTLKTGLLSFVCVLGKFQAILA